jgi:hypothetical protein
MMYLGAIRYQQFMSPELLFAVTHLVPALSYWPAPCCVLRAKICKNGNGVGLECLVLKHLVAFDLSLGICVLEFCLVQKESL